MPALPATLPWHFGGYTPPESLRELEGTSLAWVESHCTEGKELLLSQFQDKPLIEALLCALLAGVQDFDDACWKVLTERWLDTAVGVQLDRLGEIVDLGRKGWPDEVYRKLLRAQVLTLRSHGRWPDIAKILEALGVTLSLAQFSEPGMAAFRIVIGAPFVDITGHDAFNFLDRARPAGVRLTFEFPIASVATSFTWADADVDQADTLRGWSDDALSLGGYWIGDDASAGGA